MRAGKEEREYLESSLLNCPEVAYRYLVMSESFGLLLSCRLRFPLSLLYLSLEGMSSARTGAYGIDCMLCTYQWGVLYIDTNYSVDVGQGKDTMRLKRSYIKQIIQWLMAAVISMVILNGIVAGYELTPGFLHRDGGATRGVWMPNSFIVKSDEGRSISRVDRNGYINVSDDLAISGYVLFMGNSQSNGIQVDTDKRYISLINNELQGVNLDDKVYAYNVSVDGSDFCDLVSGFSASIQEFPNSAAIVLQIGSTDWSLDKMKSCTIQRIYSEEMKGSYMAGHLSSGQKLRNVIKVSFPFPIYLKEVKLQGMQLDFHDAFWYSVEKEAMVAEDSNNIDMWTEYAQTLDDVLRFLRHNYRGQIIILELPDISLTQTEDNLGSSNGIRQELFGKLCRENDMIYVNMYDTYNRVYKAHKILPYGFSNTKPGYGHLNEDGHRMVADTLFPLLEGGAE